MFIALTHTHSLANADENHFVQKNLFAWHGSRDENCFYTVLLGASVVSLSLKYLAGVDFVVVVVALLCSCSG